MLSSRDNDYNLQESYRARNPTDNKVLHQDKGYSRDSYINNIRDRSVNQELKEKVLLQEQQIKDQKFQLQFKNQAIIKLENKIDQDQKLIEILSKENKNEEESKRLKEEMERLQEKSKNEIQDYKEKAERYMKDKIEAELRVKEMEQPTVIKNDIAALGEEIAYLK